MEDSKMTSNPLPHPEIPNTIQEVDKAWLGEWLKALHEQQQKQTG
jgi:hypothetical protein